MFLHIKYIVNSVFLTCIISLITACGLVFTDNEIDMEGSESMSFRALEVTYHHPDDGPNIMFRTSKADGDFSQSISSPHYVTWPTITIFGPATIDGVVDLRYASIAMGFEATTSSENTMGIPAGTTGKVYFGLNQSEIKATLTHLTDTYTVDDDTLELYGLIGVSFPVYETLSCGLTFATSIGEDFSGISELDFRFDYLPTEHLGIMFGYRSLQYMYNADTDVSDIIMEYRGPFVGLNIVF